MGLRMVDGRRFDTRLERRERSSRDVLNTRKKGVGFFGEYSPVENRDVYFPIPKNRNGCESIPIPHHRRDFSHGDVWSSGTFQNKPSSRAK